ncbi:MAG: protease modulator HflC [Ginsengibacter sp.]
MTKKKFILSIVVLILLLIAVTGSLYIVNEQEQVVITQFGKPVGNAVTTPGVHFKVPLIQKINVFDKRYLEWDGDPNQVPTKDKKFIFVDTYARWQITDPLQFYKRLTNERGAQSRLDDILDGETRDYIANNNIEETVRNSNRTPIMTDSISEPATDSLVRIFVGREKIERRILKTANERAADLGLVILDFKIKRLNYVEEVRDQVYKRMTSERFRIADKFRSEGQGEASKINGEKERELKSIQSVAFKKAEEIKGKADATAAAIYAGAYNQSATSKSLYSFLKSMETFEKTFDDKTSIILSTDSEVWKFLKSMQ